MLQSKSSNLVPRKTFRKWKGQRGAAGAGGVNGGEHALATYAKEATADVGTPRASPSVPEAVSSIAAPFGARALATGAWFWAPHRSVLATPIARAAPVTKSALCALSAAHIYAAPVTKSALCALSAAQICSQRRTQRAERTGLSMTAAAHRVAVAAGALARPFRPSWRCQAGAAADHPEPRRSEVARFFLAVQHRP